MRGGNPVGILVFLLTYTTTRDGSESGAWGTPWVAGSGNEDDLPCRKFRTCLSRGVGKMSGAAAQDGG